MPTLPPDRCLHELFAEQVRRTPDAPALVDATTALTYRELDRRAERLAARLRALGVGPDVPVGVLMERRVEYVVACLAALKAGGAFLVLELAYPEALLRDVIADAAPRVVVTLAAHADRLPGDQARIVLDAGADVGVAPDAADGAGAGGRPAAVGGPCDPAALAFVSYSSGTTGRPKGIANPHRAAVRSYWWRFGVSDQRPGDRVACNVFFVWEMLRPLLRGATVHVIGDDVIYDPAALIAFLRTHRASETLMTPSLLETVLGRGGADLAAQLPDLRVLWLNGEIVTRTLARRVLRALPDTRVLNVYSASESHEIAAGDLRDLVDLDTTFCAVGRPLDPERTYVLDAEGRPVPPGVDGELHVGGGCLARGYLNLPDKTAAAFVDDPFAGEPGARMYRTGDRARMVGEGVLEITGRVGSMIKIRGYSVEPGSVEAALERTLAVRASAVVATGDEGDDKRLMAYVVREHDGAATGDRVTGWEIDAAGRSLRMRRELGRHLPHYMVPAVYVEVAELPVHASGKVDLARLPDPPQATAAPAAAPASAVISDEGVIAVWSDVLEVAPAGIARDDDFFDLGGHSLAVAELGARLAATFGVDLPLSDLVAAPTPGGHRDLLCAARDGAPDAGTLRDVDLAAEAVLDPDIRPRGRAPSGGFAGAGRVLLTGATGFLGAFLLDALVRETSATVVCLVRPDAGEDPQRSAVARLRAALDRRGMWRPAMAGRVEALPGDLAAPRLGLAGGAFAALARDVDAIVHAGALVNLVYPYAALREVNVGGTHEILRLACAAGATPVHHVSTNGVLPPARRRWAEDAPLDDVAGDLVDGYGQSKWVAEQLVHEAGRRGLPVTVYRPGTISGHSTTGAANARDLQGALITESLDLGCVPDVDGWYLEMTPVDYVSHAIARLAADGGTDAGVLHLADPAPLDAHDLFARFAALGYDVEPVAWDEWVARWRARRRDGTGPAPADVLRGGLPSSADLRAVTVLDDRDTRPHLERQGLTRPPIDTALLSAYTRHFHAEGWVANPPANGQGGPHA